MASKRKPCHRSLRVRRFSSPTSRPSSQRRLPRGKTPAGLAESGDRNAPGQIEIGDGQCKDLVEAVARRLKRNGQHEPEGLRRSQLAVSVVFVPLAPARLQFCHQVGTEPLDETAQLGAAQPFTSPGSSRSKVAGAVWRNSTPLRAFLARALETESRSVSRPY